MQIISKQGQWLGDIAVREAGSIEAIIEMAIRNNLSITDSMTVGGALHQPTPINKRVMTYYNNNNIYPATATTLEIKSFGGVGFMAVGISFIVS